ncbi:ArsA-related P-loop ATPase [Streptomyces sp. 549]|uniref:ArsA family ATPase n=1 Tax=Streptomyces sp. 549 TaxID=3049076 RepID=UPI0024C2DA37|nr:ArsA-related P-loop ATPase [Streptomyces sp. 549]MDK1475550.1 ArsA-related P-loop ATPase [Streptomyces sp. 549]
MPPAPGPRVVLVTGTGGAGRTTVAAATARAAAADGRRTALISADRRAADGEGFTAVAVDPAATFRAHALGLQSRGASLLDLLGSQPLDEDELTELPGAADFALLRALLATHRDGEHEVLVVDLPPAPDAVRLLALPEQLRRYLTRLLPAERQAARALRPVLAQLAGVPMPARRLYEAAERWHGELAAVQDVLYADGTSAVLVTEPGPAAAGAVAEARQGLALLGLPVDAVLANRMLPEVSPDPWLVALQEEQRRALKELAGTLGPVPLVELPHLGPPPAGTGALAALGVPPLADPAPRPEARVVDRLAEDGELVWRLPLPGAVKEELQLVRRGDEVIVTAGPFRRALLLDAALRRCSVAGARLADGELSVRFVPDPGLWPDGD